MMVEWKWIPTQCKKCLDFGGGKCSPHPDNAVCPDIRQEAEEKLAEKDKENSALMNMLTDHVAINLCEYEGDVWVDQSPEGKEHWKKCARAHIEKLLKDL